MTFRPLGILSVLPMFGLSLSRGMSPQTAKSGGLSGVVTDPSEAVMPGAKVELRDRAKGINQMKTTNSGGEYLFSFVAPGNYTLTATHSGFRIVSQNLDVSPGTTSTQNIWLVIAGASSTVKVTEEARLVHAVNGDASFTMNGLQVAQVPNPGNDLTYIAQTAPGAATATPKVEEPKAAEAVGGDQSTHLRKLIFNKSPGSGRGFCIFGGSFAVKQNRKLALKSSTPSG